MPVALGSLVLSIVIAAPGDATTFIVNSTADATDGSCDAGPGGCTLREAIEAAVAAPGRDTIRFDASVFPHGPTPVLISLASALPVIADPAGTAIDGAGASVRIDGGGAIENGLVFASASGVPLVKPTLQNVSVGRFTNDGVEICGGAPPDCDADVSGALVRNVFVNKTGGSGIMIAGHVVKKAQVVDSVTFLNDAFGIALFASSLIGARVDGSTASRTGLDAIILAAGDQTGTVVVDSFGLKSDGGEGIDIFAAGALTKPKIANVVAFLTGDNGILIRGHQVVAPNVSDVLASGARFSGVEATADTTTAPVLQKVVADRNGIFGVRLTGPVTGGEISQAHVYAHDGPGIAAIGANGLTLSGVLSTENTTGIFLAATNSTIERVHASHNSGGIIVTGGNGNTITNSASTANNDTETGITIADDSHANVIENNFALGNGVDLFDANPACDANIWSDNAFGTRSQPCIH